MIKIPEGVEVELNGNKVSVKGKMGRVEKEFNSKNIKIEKKDGNIEISGSEKKSDLVLISTIESHIKNMFKGASVGFLHKLQSVHSHFPMNLEVKADQLLIKNFIGEKKMRKAKIVGDAKVEVKGQEVTVRGASKEDVGQTCANICSATKIPRKDLRVFQDGIYMVE
jgi:large subunit ribosomal protein L6